MSETIPVPGPGYSPCPRHAGALSRLGFDRAWDIANDCPNCTAWTGTTRKPPAAPRPTGPRAIKPGCVWPRLLADADAHTRDLDSITREGAAVVGPPLRDLYELTPTGVLRLIPQPRPGTPAGAA